MDMSAAYIDAVQRGAPQAQIIFDRFHVQRLAQDAVDQVRREQVRVLAGPRGRGAAEEDALGAAQESLESLRRRRRQARRGPARRTGPCTAPTCSRRPSPRSSAVARSTSLERSSSSGAAGRRARASLPFKKLAGTIRRHLDGILAFIATGLSNGPTEGLNGKIRTITRRSYGFHSARSLIGFIFLCCTGLTLHPVFKSP